MSTLVKTFNATAALRSLALTPRLEWTAPSPLWSDLAGQDDLSSLRQPALLRFASDNFIEDLQAILAEKPETLKEQIAKPESFAEGFSSALGMTRPVPSQLKLYQPAHGHFYLVTANLICRQTTLPDRVVNAGSEKVGFVLRRLSANQEMAWVSDGEGKVWQTLTSPLELAEGEEVFPMFPLSYCDDGQKRRLWAGLVPTSSRETFKASPSEIPDNDNVAGDARINELDSKVLTRLDELQTMPFNASTEANLKEASVFLLLDFAEWLKTYLPDFWTALENGSAPTSGTTLYAELRNAKVGTSTTDFLSALKAVWNDRANIYAGSSNLTFNLRGGSVVAKTIFDNLPKLGEPKPTPASNTALPELPKLETTDSATIPLYVVRCVYLRPNCPELLGEKSQAFAIASFFDPDAPSRPVRITLPDTSIAGLRKHSKNVSFLMSNQLRKQLQTVGDAKKALKGELSEGKDFDLGVICSFSIPIITICAFVVLMIFLILLNMVFWWLPFFRICFPIKR